VAKSDEPKIAEPQHAEPKSTEPKRAEPKSAEPKNGELRLRLPSQADIDRMMSVVEQMWRRMIEIIGTLQRETEKI